MKVRLSITVDPKTEKAVDILVNEGRYRNKSHAFEEAIKRLVDETNDKHKK